VFIYATFSAVYFFQSHRPFKSLKFDCLSFNPICSVHYAYAMVKQRLQRRESSFRSGQESGGGEGVIPWEWTGKEQAFKTDK
jgi:hypothetical protein